MGESAEKIVNTNMGAMPLEVDEYIANWCKYRCFLS